MITVFDREQRDRSESVQLLTLNCDGVPRYWYIDNMDELKESWRQEDYEDDYDGPGNDDEVVKLVINGKDYLGIETFNDIVEKFNFERW